MQKSKYKNLLFDLDGTLADTGEGIINAALYAAKELNLPDISPENAKRFVGPPLVESFQNYCGLGHDEAVNAAKTFRVYYASIGLFECEVYPGMPELLQSLLCQGFRLFVATSKPEPHAKLLLEKLSLAQYFEDIAGSELSNTRTKKHEVIEYLLEKHSLKREECLMIGDKCFDMIGARKAQIDSLGVLYGYGDEEEIRGACPNLIAADIPAIFDVIANAK